LLLLISSLHREGGSHYSLPRAYSTTGCSPKLQQLLVGTSRVEVFSSSMMGALVLIIVELVVWSGVYGGLILLSCVVCIVIGIYASQLYYRGSHNRRAVQLRLDALHGINYIV